jgi:hypothetical protein
VFGVTVECWDCGRRVDRERAEFVGDIAHCPDCRPGDDDSNKSSKNRTKESDSQDVNTGDNADASRSSTPGAREALADAIAFFHAQLDRDLPDECDHDTPREYYREGRGWEASTIEDAMLGYAPASDTALLDHLMREGYDREAILGTGLFWKDGLDSVWKGRFVFSYLDDDGRPAFAISRRLGADGHPDDRAGDYGDGPAKYHKIPVSQEYVAVEEPIYGLDTVREGEPVLITEGIADAITAHEAGYPAVSPVTTTFKTSDREQLVDALEEWDVPRVYLIQDAEHPGSDVDDEGRLTLPQYGEGVRGAVTTAGYLTEHSLDARIGALPRPGLRKVDLDDYLTEWSGDLRPILAAATPVDVHPAHDPKRAALDAAGASDLSPGVDAVDTDGDHSALFDLDIRDVTGLSWDYRGPNPLGHHGDSEDYCVLLEERGVAYEHKDKVAYNALTYLLVDAGERPREDPNGALDDGEVFAAWRHAKREGLIPEDDRIPRRALQAVARKATDWDGDLVEHGTRDGDTFEALPRSVYDAALTTVREEHGLDPGRGPIGGGAGDGRGQGGQYAVETCTPPTHDPEPFDAAEYWGRLQGEQYDETLAHDGPTVWADPAGAGKTTNGILGALDRDRGTAALFDKHEKAQEVQADDALPEEYGPFHLKGGEQKRDAVCMDADHADEPCPEHGDPANCPSMCPVYDLGSDDPLRQRYDTLARELGDVRAHLALGEDLPGHDEDGACPWYEQFAAVEDADHVVGVHEYQTLQTVRDDRDILIDESPASLQSTDRVGVEGLVRAANTLADLGETLARDDPTAYTATRLAGFVRDLVDALTTPDAPTDLGTVGAPMPVWTAYETHGDAAGHYVKREEPDEDWQVGEALAKAKVAYTETVVDRIERDAWEGTPLCMDAILTAAAAAELPTDAILQAVAIPSVIDECPWCGGDLAYANGARCCASGSCGWDERENTLTRKGGERARAQARLDPGSEDDAAGLVYEHLPLVSDLPEEPTILDATATPAKIAPIYGVGREAIATFGDTPLDANMRVTQVLDGQYHASTIRAAMTDDEGDVLPREEWGTLADRIQTAIDTAGDLHDRPLFLVKQGLKPFFEFPEHGEVLHYHAARGLNREECDAVMSIGGPHPNIEDLQREGELLAQGTDRRVGGEEHSTRRGAPNPPVYRKLRYEDDAGRGRAVPTKHYTGLVGDLFREAREKELEQAIHRARPLLAEDSVDVYLLTNVPTAVPVDEVCTFEELADPLAAMLPVREGALELLAAVEGALQREFDGFRPEALVEQRDDGTVANKVAEYHRLARLAGMDVTERTVRNYVDDLEAVGLLQPEVYEPRAGVSYSTDVATLKTALSILSGNAGFEVAAVRRVAALAASADGTLEWLRWAREALGLTGARTEWDRPPDPAG